MKKFLIVLVLAFVLPGCGLLGISPEDARRETAEIMDGLRTVHTVVENVAKINDVRAEIAATNAKIEIALLESSAAFEMIVEFMAKENPTVEDAKAIVDVVKEGLAKSREAMELLKSIDSTFGKTELPPEVEASLKKLSERADRTIQKMTETAEKVEKWSNAIKSGLGLVAKLAVSAGAGPGGGALGLIGSLIGAATLAGAAASGAKKGGTA